MLFNLIIDRLLKELPNDIGCTVGSSTVNGLAFADDLILCARTQEGLNELLVTSDNFFTKCGLSINTAKCHTIALKGLGKQKKCIIENITFRIQNRAMPVLRRNDTWKYLGIQFSPEGRVKINPAERIVANIDKLTKAPLKPQQRLHALRTIVLPQLHHVLALGNIKIGCMNKCDRIIRSTVKKWTGLPHDTPSALVHAPTDIEGLGINSLRILGPLIRKERLLNLELPNFPNDPTAIAFLAKEIDASSRRLQLGDHFIDSRQAMT